MKYYVTTIYFHCDDDTDAIQAGIVAADRIEQISQDLRIEDCHTEEIQSPEKVSSEISEKTERKISC